MSTQGDRLANIDNTLEKLKRGIPDITGAALVGRDGFIIASLLPEQSDEDLIASMATTMFGVGERISSQLMSSEIEQTYVSTKAGYVLIQSINEDLMLICMTTKAVRLGVLFMELKGHVADLKALF